MTRKNMKNETYAEAIARIADMAKRNQRKRNTDRLDSTTRLGQAMVRATKSMVEITPGATVTPAKVRSTDWDFEPGTVITIDLEYPDEVAVVKLALQQTQVLSNVVLGADARRVLERIDEQLSDPRFDMQS